MDNHSANVKAYSKLREQYPSSEHYFIHPAKPNNKIYLFFDNVHILKNVRNNLMAAKKFVFPEFHSTIGEKVIYMPAGYIS